MATYAELEGHGIVGSADALPMPAGLVSQPSESGLLSAEREREIRSLDLLALMGDRAAPVVSGHLAVLLAEVDRLRAERRETNEWVDDAAEALRADRDRIAELEAVPRLVCRVCEVPVAWVDSVTGGWWQHASPVADGHGITPRPATAPKESAAKLAALLAPTQALRESGPSAEWVAETFSPQPAVEGEFHAYLHRAFTTPHDLPETGGAR
jgi:uncharacterized small protein (DUF1192 family)